ncbi:MAG TPA: M20/M25/M40 family metallo-hydrolase [Pirellulales bacterium]|nr:M20/M25/M40 family metallo-hydrolase [Pirellulales bacterium]
MPLHYRFCSVRAVCHLFALVAVLAGAARAIAAAENATEAQATEVRLYEAVKFLASDEREGRGVGTKGLDQAADFIAQQFAATGLKTSLFDGGPFQKFSMVVATEQGQPNRLKLLRPAGDEQPDGQTIELKPAADFNPLAIGGSGQFNLPLVFAGYGITAKDEKYDDYAGINVEGKAVLLLRHEPEQNNPHSAFNGTDHSVYAPFTRKVSNAYQHGAAAVVFGNDEFDLKKNVERRMKRWQAAVDELTASQAKFEEIAGPSPEQVEQQRRQIDKLLKEVGSQSEKLWAEYDPLLPFFGAGSGAEAHKIPVVFCRRAALDPVVKAALGKTLTELEKQIDAGPTPASAELAGWRLEGEIAVVRREAEVKNVVAVLEGEGPHADETIVVGAHYDHLGMGGEGSLAAGVQEVHNGADDNASGTAALIEVARRLASRTEKLPRRVVFLAFTGEERGLIGSARYCRDPLVPLDKTVAMLNMDMVGRLADDKLIVQGVDTATEFGPVIDHLADRYGLKVTKQPGGFGPSDHSSFYPHKVPVMHFFTGTHSDYHRPSDDYEKINLPGMRRVAEMVADTVVELAELGERPHYQAAKSKPQFRGGDRPYFGSIPDFGSDEPGYHLGGVSPDSPADKGGLKAGDAIVKLGEYKIGNLEDFDGALRKFKAGDKVSLIVNRDGKPVTLEVVLDPPR